jgi:transcription elongation GreA/GreB family factor
MSRAFVKDDDPSGGAAVLPDRPISPHPNLVTQRGRQLIEARVAEFEHRLAEAADNPEAQARAARELRYWTARLATARVELPPAALSSVRFATTVVCVDASGHDARYAIVGEDEAEPNIGRIAWTSPVARALLGSEPGDLRQLPKGEVEIVAIEPIEE